MTKKLYRNYLSDDCKTKRDIYSHLCDAFDRYQLGEPVDYDLVFVYIMVKMKGCNPSLVQEILKEFEK